MPTNLGYTPMAANDEDSFVYDCTANMTARNDSIASVGTPVVTRSDKAPITSEDISVSGVSVIQNGMQIGYKVTSGGNIGSYKIVFPITLTSGTGPLNRSVTITVNPSVG